MQPSPKPTRTTGPSRTALAVASLAAAAALAIPVAITGVGFARGADGASAASAAQPAPIAVDPAVGEQVVVDTIYVVTADPAGSAAPSGAGMVDQERDDEGQHEREAEDD